MCRAMGNEPDPAQIPPEEDDFSEDFQICFSLLRMLPDRWDSMNGVYLGRDFSTIFQVLEIFKVDKRLYGDYYGILKYIDQETTQVTNDRLAAQRKTKK